MNTLHGDRHSSAGRRGALGRLPRTLRASWWLPAVLAAAPAAAQQRDSVVVQAVSTWQKDVDRLRDELMAQRNLELEFRKILGTLELKMRAAPSDSQRSQLAQSELVYGRLRQASQEQLRIRRQLESLCADVRRPDGYLGVATTGIQLVDKHVDGTTIVRFLEPPVVASVDPGSPADRVGIRAGDVLIELGGKRLLQSNVVFAELLRPGERLPVKLQRGRDTVTYTPVVEPAPAVATPTPCASVDAKTAYVLSPLPGQVRVEAVPDQPGRFAYVYTRSRKDTSAVAVTSARPIPVSGVFAGPMAQWYSGGANSLAGIQLVPLNAESGRAFGVSHGLFVNTVMPGTPGREAGLQGGDVLLSADSTDLRTIAALQRVISRSRDRSVTIVLIRDRKQETVRLRWQ